MAEHMMENDYLKVTVSDHGAELVSVLVRRRGEKESGGQIQKSGIGTHRFFFPLWGG